MYMSTRVRGGTLCPPLASERVTLSRVCVPRVKVFNLREGEGEIQEGSNYMRLYIVLPNQSVTYLDKYVINETNCRCEQKESFLS